MEMQYVQIVYARNIYIPIHQICKRTIFQLVGGSQNIKILLQSLFIFICAQQTSEELEIEAEATNCCKQRENCN